MVPRAPSVPSPCWWPPATHSLQVLTAWSLKRAAATPRVIQRFSHVTSVDVEEAGLSRKVYNTSLQDDFIIIIKKYMEQEPFNHLGMKSSLTVGRKTRPCK